jgi:hypothetical protein
MKNFLVVILRGALALISPWTWGIAFGILILLGLCWGLLASIHWESAVNFVQKELALHDRISWVIDSNLGQTFGALTWRWRDFTAPLMLAVLILPCVVASSALAISVFALPAITRRVAMRRYPSLVNASAEPASESRNWKVGIARVGEHVLVAVVYAFCATFGLSAWFEPVVGGLITAMIGCTFVAFLFSSSVLASVASHSERKLLLARHRMARFGLALWGMLWLAVPVSIWLAGVSAFVFAPALALVGILFFVMVLLAIATSFVHYLLGALMKLRMDASLEPNIHVIQ